MSTPHRHSLHSSERGWHQGSGLTEWEVFFWGLLFMYMGVLAAWSRIPLELELPVGSGNQTEPSFQPQFLEVFQESDTLSWALQALHTDTQLHTHNQRILKTHRVALGRWPWLYSPGVIVPTLQVPQRRPPRVLPA